MFVSSFLVFRSVPLYLSCSFFIVFDLPASTFHPNGVSDGNKHNFKNTFRLLHKYLKHELDTTFIHKRKIQRIFLSQSEFLLKLYKMLLLLPLLINTDPYWKICEVDKRNKISFESMRMPCVQVKFSKYEHILVIDLISGSWTKW